MQLETAERTQIDQVGEADWIPRGLRLPYEAVLGNELAYVFTGDC